MGKKGSKKYLGVSGSERSDEWLMECVGGAVLVTEWWSRRRSEWRRM